MGETDLERGTESLNGGSQIPGGQSEFQVGETDFEVRPRSPNGASDNSRWAVQIPGGRSDLEISTESNWEFRVVPLRQSKVRVGETFLGIGM